MTTPPPASPRFATPRDPRRPTTGPRVAASAAALGRPFGAHQHLIANVAGELLPDGRPAYPEVAVVMPRRGGKTITVLAVLVERLRRSPQVRGFYTAQTAEDGVKVLRDEWQPLVDTSSLRRVMRFRFARGDAGMYVQIGRRRLSRVEVFTPNANALHGRDADVVCVDEAWSHSAARGEDIDAGIRPARWNRPASQLWVVSAGGTPGSGYLHRFMDRGRAGEPGLAYFEWSADAEAPGYDPYDEALWWATHPGLGAGTVHIDQVRADARAMPRADFERAMLCVWDRTTATALLSGWSDSVDPTARVAGGLTLAFDVNPERTHAALAMAGAGAVELVDHHPGTSWLPGRIDQLCRTHDVEWIVRDRRSPAGATTLGDDLGAEVRELGGADVAAACAWLVDALRIPDTLAIRPHADLSVAFGQARAANLGDGQQVWVRRSHDDDLSPLYAVTLAAWASATAPTGAIY